jgi:hypothetical protein
VALNQTDVMHPAQIPPPIAAAIGVPARASSAAPDAQATAVHAADSALTASAVGTARAMTCTARPSVT